MASILGSIFVNLSANTADFVAGMSQASSASRKAGREIQESFRGLGDIAGRMLGPLGEVGARVASTLQSIGDASGKAVTKAGALGGVMAGAAAAAVGLGGALVASAVHAAEVGNRIFEMGEKTGLSTKNLAGLMALTKLTGESWDTLSVALGRGEANLAKAALTGGKSAVVLFQLMGGAKGAAELGLKPMDDRLVTVLKRIFDLNDVGQRNLALTELLGRGWQTNIETLKMLAEQGYGPAIEMAKKMGITMDAAKAHEFIVQMDLLKAELDGISLTIGSKLVPSLSDAMAGLSVWSTVWGDVGRELVDVGKIWAALATRDIGGASLAMADWAKQNSAIQNALSGATKAANDNAAALAKEREQADSLDSKLKGLTSGVHQHADELERAAERAREFWKEFNLGLAEAKTTLPVVTTYFSALADKISEIAKTDLASKFSTFAAMGTGGGGILKGAGPIPGGVTPFAPPPGENAVIPLPEDVLAASTKRISDLLTPQLTKLQATFKNFFDQIAADGRQFGQTVFDSLGKAVEGISGQLAHLVVTGKTSFRQLFQGLEEEVLKAGFQRALGQLASVMSGRIGASTMPRTTGPPGTPGTTTSQAPAGGIGGIFGTIFGRLGGKAGAQPGLTPSSPLYVSEVSGKGGLGSLPGARAPGAGEREGAGPFAGVQTSFNKIASIFGFGKWQGGQATPGSKPSGTASDPIYTAASALGGNASTVPGYSDSNPLFTETSTTGTGLGSSASYPLFVSDISSQGGGGGVSSGLLDGGGDGSGDGSSGGGGGSLGGGGGSSRWIQIAMALAAGMANGGAVRSRNLYLVGEKGPEFFVPSSPGVIHPKLELAGGGGKQNPEIHNHFHFGDAGAVDSFKRSQTQILAQLQHSMVTAYSRSR